VTPTATQNGQAVADIHEVGQRWAKAELDGDTAALADLLTGDFVGVGPRGFVLDKRAWLGRYASGALVHSRFAWQGDTVRVYGDTAVVIGIEESTGSYGGHQVDSRSRATHVLVRGDGGWRLAGVHLSPAPAA
jgi:uncharacterized protein (TIGR02246 family)